MMVDSRDISDLRRELKGYNLQLIQLLTSIEKNTRLILEKHSGFSENLTPVIEEPVEGDVVG